MRKIFVSVFVAALFAPMVLTAQTAESQQEESPFDYGVSLDFQSRYIWRGQSLGGSAACLQPGTYFNWKGLEIGAWGSFSMTIRPYAELDLYLSYTFWKDRFTVIFTDYSFPFEEDADFNYFDYENNHVLEAGFSYNGEEKVPISAGVFVNVFGADAQKENGKNVYSVYGELAYNPRWEKTGVDFSIFVGFAFNGPAYKDAFGDPVLGFYGTNKFGVVNTGVSATKTFQINKTLSIPLSAALIFNPCSKKAYFTASVGIAL
ncbi:MAG: hypothetical protein LBR36_05790 [Bacteroidales bacterium]|jgi:hypothetical protein|nr:hypothetical protein [Bacteroidales bacterium]